MTPSDWKLILLAMVAIGFLVLLITRWKVNAFVSLLLSALVVGAGAVWLAGPGREAPGKLLVDPAGATKPYTMFLVVKSFGDGLGATLGGIAAVLGLGTMLGRLLAESDGATVLAKRFASFFGPQRIQWCIMVLALAVGLATWFAVGLVLLLPILLTLTHETRQPFLRLALPLLACLSVMHGLMPPHPGPVVAVEALHASMGLVLFWGLVVGIPTAAVAGPFYAWIIAGRVTADPPPLIAKARGSLPGLRPPGFGLTLFTILLPVLLMLVATLAELTLSREHVAREVATFIGHPTIALLLSVLVAMVTLGTNCGYRPADLLLFTEQSIATIGMTILVVGGGGGFARVLRDSGVAESIGRFADTLGLPPLLYGWMIAAFIRVATGSATVSIVTASGLLGPVLAQHPELNPHQIALIICALGCGSLFLSHLNDAGFWIVRDCLGLSVAQTFKTWSVSETIIGLTGMVFSLIAYQWMAG